MTTTPTSAPLLLTPEETAAILRRDVDELREWRATDTGPTFLDLGRGLIRYARASVLEVATTAA